MVHECSIFIKKIKKIKKIKTMGELLKTLKEQNSSELITKWENIGFLSNTKNKRNSALACEFSALYLLDNIEKYNGDITTLTHPVIVRIFRKIEEDLPTQLIFDKVVEIITTFKIKLDGMKKTDEWINRGENKVKEVEAEFIADFSDNFPFKFGPARG
jgi:hypothetical protein